MVNSCCVATCRFKYSRNCTRSFHKFPLKNPKVLEKWILFTGNTGNWAPNNYSYMCSAHFTNDCFANKRTAGAGANLRLLPDAVPSIVTSPCEESEVLSSYEKGMEDADISEPTAREELPPNEAPNSETSYDEEAVPSKRKRTNLSDQKSIEGTSKTNYVIKIVSPEATALQTNKVTVVIEEDCEPKLVQDESQGISVNPGPSTVHMMEESREEEVTNTKSDDDLEVVAVVMDKLEDNMDSSKYIAEESIEEDLSDYDMQSDDIDLLPISEDDNEEDLEIFNEEQVKIAAATMQKKCRICSSMVNGMIDIFSKKGEERQLLNKIKRCLPIKAPQESDTLPHKICISCEQRLKFCDDFAQIAMKSDKEFRMEDIKINLPVATSTVEYVSEEDDAESSVESFEDQYDEEFKPTVSESESDFSDISDVKETKKKTPTKKVKKTVKPKKVTNKIKKSDHKCKVCDKIFKTNHDLILHSIKIHHQSICKICETNFETKIELDDHYRNTHFHVCKMCNEVFTDIKYLKKHLKLKHPNYQPKFISGKYTIKENIKCTLCTHISQDNRYAKRHYFMQHKKYACEICFELFPNSEVQVEHTLQIHGIPCKYCNKVFYCNNNLKVHENTAHKTKNPIILKKSPSQLYECKTCNKGLLSKTNIKRHNYWCHKLFTCEFCLHECNSFDELDKHFIDKHGKVCYYCNKEFDSIDRLTLHIDYVHADYIPYCCEYCGEYFKNRNLLKLHRGNHKEDTDIYHCNDCGQGFSTEKLLTAHRKYRHSERKHLCGHCDKKFITGYDLRKHLKSHERKDINKKPYQCTLCNKSLGSIRSLQRHVQVQHNKVALVKPHKCHICRDKFTTKTNLKKHMKTLHFNLTYYKCLICSQDYSSEENIISHLSFHKPIQMQNLKTPYVKVEAMNCEFCKNHFSCKVALTKHIINRHLVYKLNLKPPPKMAKLQQIFQLCKMKQQADSVKNK